MQTFIKKILLCLSFVAVIFSTGLICVDDVQAAAKKKKVKASLTEEQLVEMNKQLNTLTRKIYSNSLFSPKDNETMITIKLDLDDAMLKMVSPEYAPLYYLEANLLKKRNYKNEAIDCYQTIMENFSDTAFAPKAKQELLKMGVTIEEPNVENSEDELEE